MDLKYCISTNKDYSKKTLPTITQSLLNNGIHPNQIFIFESGHKEANRLKYNKMTIIHSIYSSFEFTPLIEIIQNQIKADYWFLIHDTCEVGSNFQTLLTTNMNEIVLPNRVAKLALKNKPSMNIGLYKYDYLLKHKKLIMSFANKRHSKLALNKIKEKTIVEEDCLFTLEDESNYICLNGDMQVQILNLKINSIYETPRIIEYYAQLDLYKYKANHGQTNMSTGFHISL